MHGLDGAGLAHVLYAPYTFPLADRGITKGVMAELKRLQAVGPGALRRLSGAAGASVKEASKENSG